MVHCNYCKNDKPHTLLLHINSEWCTEEILETVFEEPKEKTLKNVLNGAMLQKMNIISICCSQ
jgi:hypothetical protein